ncbi:hypothetical protein ABCW43_02410 [Neorhizobium sp. IRAMC:178]|uniref:hypothetical protein n=1 Tax=Neorhizobium tunisiense TaxID=3144793 RepID=UPI0031F63123
MKTNDAITQDDVARSYLIIALLQVTRDAADYLNDHGEPVGKLGERSGSIAAVLDHIGELQGELHDALERATRESDGEAE